jgi:hypothetical protein
MEISTDTSRKPMRKGGRKQVWGKWQLNLIEVALIKGRIYDKSLCKWSLG